MHFKKMKKKVLALTITAALVTAAALPAFAAAVPSAEDTAAVKIMNVEEGLTVTAYQVVSATYDAKGNGLTGYAAASGVSIADIEAITADEAAEIARNINAGTLKLNSETLSYNANGTSNDTSDDYYTADLEAGTWIVLVSGSNYTAYNVMIVSNYYTDANDGSSLTAGTVDADGDFTEITKNEDGTATEAVIYAKKTTASIDKTITDADAVSDSVTDADTGDTVGFQIDTVIPDYSGSYDDGVTTFTITDTLTEGLTLLEDTLTVQVGGQEADLDDSDILTVTIAQASGKTTITLAFASDYILDHTTEAVTVTYSATVNDAAVMAEDANTNDAVLTYSNEPGTWSGSKFVSHTKSVSDEVYVYSFEIDDEIAKVKADGSVSADGDDVTVDGALAGATFTLYTDESCESVYTNENTDGSYTTGSDGFIRFEGLDAGVYYLAETEAPANYTINDDVYKIVIEAAYNADGTISGYTVSVTNLSDADAETMVSEYTMNYADGEVVQTASENPTAIVDITLSKLPSTGGAGLYLIILASAGAAAAAGIAAASKKNRAHHA